MGYTFQSEVHPSYLHLRLPDGFVITSESSAEAWLTLSRLCEESERGKVLLELRKPEPQLDTMSAFESGRTLAQAAVGLSIAVCFHDYKVDEFMIFFRTVAQNRGAKVEFFSDIDAALQWLDAGTGERAAGNQ